MAKQDGGLFAVTEVAADLGLSEADVRQWARGDGGVPRIGATWVFRVDDVARLAADLDECSDYYAGNPSSDDDESDGDDYDDDDDDGDDGDESYGDDGESDDEEG